MSTGFTREIKIIITGDLNEDYEDDVRKSDMIEAELNVIVTKYGLSMEFD